LATGWVKAKEFGENNKAREMTVEWQEALLGCDEQIAGPVDAGPQK
jgi:hypothetical protein